MDEAILEQLYSAIATVALIGFGLLAKWLQDQKKVSNDQGDKVFVGTNMVLDFVAANTGKNLDGEKQIMAVLQALWDDPAVKSEQVDQFLAGLPAVAQDANKLKIYLDTYLHILGKN